jgi:hypothetical protein
MNVRTVLLLAIALVPALGFGSCQPRPDVPKQVTIVVEKRVPTPAWATDELPKPQPVDGTVGARNRSHDARGAVIDIANCHRRLLKKLDAGELVNPMECSQP